MKIWQLGPAANPARVDGASRAAWLLSCELARMGHEVTVVIDSPPEPLAVEITSKLGMKIVEVKANYLSYPNEMRRLLVKDRPELVHMHSVFIVRQATLGRILKHELHIPYIVTPHGGLMPQVLRRGILKKATYSWLRERPRFMNSEAIALVAPGEEDCVRDFVPDFDKIVRWMPNAVEIEHLDSRHWKGNVARKRVVFLGRFDVLGKGVDVLMEIARRAPEINFELYGTEDRKTLRWLNRLKSNQPSNVTFHKPVFAADKAELLSGVSFYLQPSRWEGFPVSVAECLYLGVPTGISGALTLAPLFKENDLGLVIPLDPPKAAEMIRQALDNPDQLRAWAAQGRKFALEHFHPKAVAQKHVDLYNEVLGNKPDGKPPSNGQAKNGQHRTNGHASKFRLIPVGMRGSLKSNISRMVERSNHLRGQDQLPRTVVLCYHSIFDADSDLAVSPENFRRQLRTLREMGFDFLNFGDLVRHFVRDGVPKKNVACITFDDGYLDNLTHAAPILSQFNIPATTFVTTGLMSQHAEVVEQFKRLTRYETNYLTPKQTAELSTFGFEIGAHTVTHANLARLSLQETRREIIDSKAALEDAIGKSVWSFAYPFGKRHIHYTPMTVSVVREAGFSGAAAVAFRSVTPKKSVLLFQVPRFFVTRTDSINSFKQKVAGHYDWLGSIQENTPAWLKAVVSPEDKY